MPKKATAFPSHLSATALAALLSYTRRHISRLTADGILKETARGYDVIASVAANLAYREGLIAGQGDFGKARTQWMVEKALNAKLIREEREHKLVPVDKMSEVIVKHSLIFKTVALRLPSKYAPVLFQLPTIAAVASTLTKAVHETLETLQEMMAAVARATPGADGRLCIEMPFDEEESDDDENENSEALEAPTKEKADAANHSKIG